MKISVVMVDGGFRENTFSAEYLSKQDFLDTDYEILWVEYYNHVPESVLEQQKVTVIKLNNPKDKEYHSSYCFNEGIKRAKGELIVIPDADQIVKPNFLSLLWELHSKNVNLVVYPYRYDEISEGILSSTSFEELEKKCVLKNPLNYGGCLSVRKKWLIEINGYEQNEIFKSGFHANGLDIYTRFKNLGLAIMWAPHIKMYHPWHPYTLANADQYNLQRKFIDWRFKNLQYQAINGIDPSINYKNFDTNAFIESNQPQQQNQKPTILKRIVNKIK